MGRNKLRKTASIVRISIKKIILCIAFIIPFCSNAQDLKMKASTFGIRSDGITLNTTSIQKAIDYIHEQGGGTLEFYVGRYLTGALVLKSNVSICLHEGAILVGSTNIYDYRNVGYAALINADHQSNICITGKGVIEGQGRELVYKVLAQVHSGIIKDKLNADRPKVRPNIINFNNCKNIEISKITLKDAACWVQRYNQCENIKMNRITVDSKIFWNNDGLDFIDCKNVKVTNSYIDAADDAICFKSEDTSKICENIEIRNCVARSSANGIKFGSSTEGGYKNIRIINNKVYDTFRSALNIASPDGGAVEDIFVDSLYAVNVGNGIYLRLNARSNKELVGEMKNITIQNAHIEVSASKPDAGYGYEGPVEDLPRNICPCAIMGLPDRIIKDVTLRNIEIVHPGGGDPFYAKVGTTPEELDAIPEQREMYPDFSKFKELPAWGFFIRHAKGLKFENVTLTAQKKDYRPSVVIVNVENSSLKEVNINEPGSKGKEQVIQYKTKNISISKN